MKQFLLIAVSKSQEVKQLSQLMCFAHWILNRINLNIVVKCKLYQWILMSYSQGCLIYRPLNKYMYLMCLMYPTHTVLFIRCERCSTLCATVGPASLLFEHQKLVILKQKYEIPVPQTYSIVLAECRVNIILGFVSLIFSWKATSLQFYAFTGLLHHA